MADRRSRSRSPYRSRSSQSGLEPYVIRDSRSPSEDRTSRRSNSQRNSNEGQTLYMSNLPLSWNFERIKQFIKDNTMSSQITDALQFVFVLKDSNGKSKGACLAKFSNISACKQALKQFSGIMCEGKRISATMDAGNMLKDPSKSRKHEERNSRQRPQKQMQPSSNENNTQMTNLILSEASPRPLMQVHTSLETYGLSMEFLNTLGIKLPLLNKIFIANLDPKVDEAKLREVFGYAGQILNLFMIRKKDGKRSLAKIEYDHPVEAVQAISMFNGQELYNVKLIVQMDSSPHLHAKNLPEGLRAMGPGLGTNGEPMRGVRNTVELEPLKNLLLQEFAKIKSLTSNSADNSLNINNQSAQVDSSGVGLMNNPVLNIQNPMTSMSVNTLNPLNQTTSLLGLNPLLNTQAQNMHVLQGIMQQGVGTDLTATLAALQAQNMTQSVPSFTQNMTSFAQNMPSLTSNLTSLTQQMPNLTQKVMSNQNEWRTQVQSQSDLSASDSNSYGRSQSSYDANRRNYNDSFNLKDNSSMDMDIHKQSDDNDRQSVRSSDMLVFNNLPSSVTVQALSSKMREVGEVKFAEMTGQGRAIVRFLNMQDAERCIKLFDRSKVDGQVIEVNFF